MQRPSSKRIADQSLTKANEFSAVIRVEAKTFLIEPKWEGKP